MLKNASSGFVLLLLSPLVNAGICTNQLQEEANVFEVNCPAGDPRIPCTVTGYFYSDPIMKLAYGGVQASIWSGELHPKNKDGRLWAVIETYRYNKNVNVGEPPGYWQALVTAIRIRQGRPLKSHFLAYYDAHTSERVPNPKMKCVELQK
jgi:hypothetical protein